MRNPEFPSFPLDSVVRDCGLLIVVPTAHMLVTGTWWVFRKL